MKSFHNLDKSSSGSSKKTFENVIHVYENDGFLIDVVASFFESGFRTGRRAVVVANTHRRKELKHKLQEMGVDLREYPVIEFDAHQVLGQVMHDHMPDESQFRKFYKEMLQQVTLENESQPNIRVFGEMVSLLWSAGNVAAAIKLEALWNEAASTSKVSVLCAYPAAVYDSIRKNCADNEGVVSQDILQ